MHELPITERIVKIAEDYCREAGAEKVATIHLVIGDDSGIVGSSVQMYFDVITEGTCCENAALDITHIKPKLRCKNCGALFERAFLSFNCPECGGEGERTDIGREFYIDTIEVVTDDPADAQA